MPVTISNLGVGTLAGQYIGGPASVPVTVQFSAALASGLAAGTNSGK